MNERIKELLLKAGWDGYEALDGRNQKFAELIVDDCIDIIRGRKYQAMEESWLVDEAMSVAEMDLEEHFGVLGNQIKVGSRIEVISGFHVGARGTVNYIEPSGRMWVRRDGASSDVFYNPEEVIGVEDV